MAPPPGITTCTALISALGNIPVRHDVAMTGEITLRGRVLAIGGLREKSMAAYKNGIKTVIIPAANEPDLAEIDDVVKKAIHFVPVHTMEEVLEQALVQLPVGPKSAATTPQPPSTRKHPRWYCAVEKKKGEDANMNFHLVKYEMSCGLANQLPPKHSAGGRLCGAQQCGQVLPYQ